jgi:hypothetical protein
MHEPRDEFDQITANWNAGNTVPEYLDNNPYGPPASAIVKPGLTKRGKAALGIGAAVIAGGSLIGYQAHAANMAEQEAKAQEIALKAEALELEKLREMNRAAEVNRKVALTVEQTRQASIDTCVKSKTHLVGKGYNPLRYRDLVDDCQAQYTATTSLPEMEAASSAQATAQTSGGTVSNGLLIGCGALALGVLVAAKRGARSNPA